MLPQAAEMGGGSQLLYENDDSVRVSSEKVKF